MELIEYLPNKLMIDIKNNAIKNTKEFSQKNDSTKLAICDHLKLENEKMSERKVGKKKKEIGSAGFKEL